MNLLSLLEARKNPDINPKDDVCNELKKFKNENIYATFSDSTMLNIREYHADGLPSGIYGFKINTLLNKMRYDSSSNGEVGVCAFNMYGDFPKKENIILFYPSCDRILDNTYSDKDLKKDIDKLLTYVLEYYKHSTEDIYEIIEYHSQYLDSQQSILLIIKNVASRFTNTNVSLASNSMFRYLGYCGIEISGPNPLSSKNPKMAISDFTIFLSPMYVKIVDLMKNNTINAKPQW